MGIITEQNKWEESVYLIEENDPVHGGEEGVSNKAAKQLANRTLYLRQQLIAAGQKITPKKLTATTKNTAGADGHTHEIDLASLTTKGLVQLTNDTGLDSESLALTAKAGKALAQAIAKAQQMAAGKWTGTDATTSQKGIAQLNSATNSNAENQAATPKAVKAAFDRASTAINNAQAAQTAASNAQATANSKQSPATTLVGYGITDFIHKNLTSENLNDIKQTGIYGQARDANATTARNYPEQMAGALLVHPSAYGFMQEYVTYSGYRRYIRNQNASGGWADWKRIDFQLNNTLTSTSTTQALTAAQGKKLNDDKVNRSGDTIKGNLVLDKTAQNEWSALYLKSKGGDYRFEGNPVDSDNRLNIVHQVGSTQKYLRMRKFDNDEFFAYESWVKNGFAPIHNPSHTGTILGNYRLVIDRNEAAYTPYINLKDSSVDFAKAVTNEKAVSDINTYIKNGENERGLSTLRTMIKTDKNATGHYGVIGADGTMRWAWSAFGKTGNLAIGKTADDGTHKLQVAGSIHATGQTILNSPTAIVRFQNGGTNYGYVGFPASNSKNIRFSSNLWGNSYLELQESKIVAGQALYEGGNRVQHHGQRYAEVTTANGVLSGLSVNLNGTWFGRVESSDDKRWKFIHNGDRAYWLPRNTSNQDKTIATTDDVNTRLPLTGGTLTGVLAINNGSYSTLSQRNAANGHTRLEVLPDNNTNFYKISYWNASNAETNNALFPKSGTGKIVAYQDWVNSRLAWGNISGKPQIEPNLVTLFKGEFHSVSVVRDVTTGRVSNGVITLAQSFKNFKYIVCVTSNDEKTAYLQQVLMTSLIPVGNTANSNWGLSGSTLYWTGRFTSNTTIQCIAENCVLHAIYGTNAI